MKNYSVLVLMTLLTGCVSMNVEKVTGLDGEKTICIINNSKVKQAFRDAYERQIQAKGYLTKVVANKDNPACKITTVYTARYGIHWGAYLKTANLKILKDNNVIGEASYRAPYASLEKHGRVEGKIKSMVDELLPAS